MAMTVTATMSGTPTNEHVYLWIRVLTGATEAGGASASGINATGGASVTASLTPNFSSSLPCFALTADNWGGSYTAAASNTIDSNNNDPDVWGAGFGRYTGAVTGGTPLTFGASGVGGGCDYSTWACYEVPSSGGGTPAVDASSPALASATGAGIKTVTSASFTPPAGSVVVAMVCGGGNGTSGPFAMAVSGGSLTWTQRAGNATAADQDTFVFTATVPGGASPGQVSAWQLPWPPALTQAFGPGAPFTATSFQIDPAPQVQVTAGLASGAAAAAAPSFSLYITGLGGTGAGYFRDQNSNPRMVLGDAAWALPGNAGRWNSGNWQGDYDGYLANRAAQGFTVIYAKPIGTTQSGCLDDFGKTFDSLYPFQGGTPATGVSGANPSSGLTSAFWARIDYFLASALAKGITVFLNAIGYASDFDSGPGPLAGKSSAEFQAYGAALGARYASQPNLIWNLADDYFGSVDTKISAFLTGLRGAGDSHPVSIENYPESTSRQDLPAGTALPWGTSNAQYNWVYSYNVTYYGVEKAYLESSPVPVIWGDGYFYQGGSGGSYQGGTGAFAYDHAMRQDAWHAVSSGARGWVNGSEGIWQYQSTALAASALEWWYVNGAGKIRQYVESLPGWYNLVPDTSSALVTGGRGTHASSLASGGGGGQYEVAFTDSYVTASCCADKSLAVIYLSHATTITIDQTQVGAGYTATWVDPLTLATSAATPGSTYNSTAKGSNSAGEADWVLVLQAPLSASAPSGLATGTGTAQGPAASAGVNSVLAAGAGAAQLPAAGAGVNALVAAGAGAAQNAVAAAGVNAAAATGAGAAQSPAVSTAAAVSAVAATGAGAALNATASTTSSGTASAVLAAGAGAAQPPAVTATASVTPVPAAGTGAAQNPAAGAGASAAAATGTGAALNAAASTSAAGNAAAGLASGAGAASGAVPAAGVNAPAAPGTAAAQPAVPATGALAAAAPAAGTAAAPAPAAGASAGLASGTGTARNATAGTSSAGNANAGLATGTGTAQGPAVAVTAAVTATAATGSGSAQGATGQASRAVTAVLAAGAGAAQGPALTLAAIARAAAAQALAAALSPAAVAVLPFTVGTLTASDHPSGVLASAAASTPQSTLTASDQRTGGPGG